MQANASTVSSGAVTALTLRKIGGYAAAPLNPLSRIAATAGANGGGPCGGSGVQANLTTAAANLETPDGIHPGPTTHAYLGGEWRVPLPSLLN